MNNNYFRITGYYLKEDFCFIVDSNGMFEKLWQFSSHLIKLGIEIVEVSKLEDIIDINIAKADEDKNNILLRAISNGKPDYINQTVNELSYKAVKVADKIYIPNKA